MAKLDILQVVVIRRLTQVVHTFLVVNGRSRRIWIQALHGKQKEDIVSWEACYGSGLFGDLLSFLFTLAWIRGRVWVCSELKNHHQGIKLIAPCQIRIRNGFCFNRLRSRQRCVGTHNVVDDSSSMRLYIAGFLSRYRPRPLGNGFPGGVVADLARDRLEPANLQLGLFAFAGPSDPEGA